MLLTIENRWNERTFDINGKFQVPTCDVACGFGEQGTIAIFEGGVKFWSS